MMYRHKKFVFGVCAIISLLNFLFNDSQNGLILAVLFMNLAGFEDIKERLDVDA